jgi:hypothetical protein
MKKFLVCLAALMAFSGSSYAQVTVTKPNSDVSASSHEVKWNGETLSAKYLADGNSGRLGFNIGQGVPLSQYYGNLPKTVGDFRIVPLVTMDANGGSSETRTTVALLAPKLQLLNGFKAQFGLAAKGWSSRNWNAVNGAEFYVGVDLNFKELSKAFGLRF